MDQSTVIYRYDGTWEGFLSCVFEAFVRKEEPFCMLPYDEAATMLFEERFVETDMEKAARVERSFEEKISPRAAEMIERGFLTCLENKEVHLLRYIRLGYRAGSRISGLLTVDCVDRIERAVKFLQREAHAMIEFVRFSEYGGVLVSVIEPKNRVLGLMAGHFSDRFPQERLLIWDKTHKEAFLWGNGKKVIAPLEQFEEPTADAREGQFRLLWKRFFDAVAIEERINPACQRTHLPLRYRGQMTEFMMESSFLPEEQARRALKARRAKEAKEADMPPEREALLRLFEKKEEAGEQGEFADFASVRVRKDLTHG